MHKRLMLLATLAILGPALARLSRLPIFGASEQGPFVAVVSLALLGAGVVHDLVTRRRIHPATILGIALPLGLFFAGTAISTTAFGVDLVRSLR